MRVVVLGTGDLTKIPRFTKISEKQLRELVDEVARLLAEKGCELVIIPDRGIPSEVARVYKQNGGKRVWGVVPTKDKVYGVKHIQPYLHLLDKRIKVDSWYDADGTIAASGSVCVVFGMSPGIMREFAALKYHYRYLGNKTKVIWFKNTISAPIAREITEEIPVIYVDSIEELAKLI